MKHIRRFLNNQFSINELTGFNNTGNVCKCHSIYIAVVILYIFMCKHFIIYCAQESTCVCGVRT